MQLLMLIVSHCSASFREADDCWPCFPAAPSCDVTILIDGLWRNGNFASLYQEQFPRRSGHFPLAAFPFLPGSFTNVN